MTPTLFNSQVSGLPDFFQDDDVFIAYGQERLCHDDFDIAANGRSSTVIGNLRLSKSSSKLSISH